jgi:hypothetical protein
MNNALPAVVNDLMVLDYLEDNPFSTRACVRAYNTCLVHFAN